MTGASGLREPLWTFAIATALAAGLAAVGAVVPFVRDNLHAPIAIIFLYAPAIAARRAGREFDYREAGLRLDPLPLNLAVLGLFSLLTFPAFVGGFFEIFAAFQAGETAGTRALFILSGVVSILFGVVLFARPGVGAVTLALLFGLFSIIYGVSEIVMGVELRRTGHTVGEVLEHAA